MKFKKLTQEEYALVLEENGLENLLGSFDLIKDHDVNIKKKIFIVKKNDKSVGYMQINIKVYEGTPENPTPFYGAFGIPK